MVDRRKVSWGGGRGQALKGSQRREESHVKVEGERSDRVNKEGEGQEVGLTYAPVLFWSSSLNSLFSHLHRIIWGAASFGGRGTGQGWGSDRWKTFGPHPLYL